MLHGYALEADKTLANKTNNQLRLADHKSRQASKYHLLAAVNQLVSEESLHELQSMTSPALLRALRCVACC